MQFKPIPAFLIFIGSYLPLAIILAIQDIPTGWWKRPLCSPLSPQGCDYIPFDHPVSSLLFLSITTVSVLLAQALLRKVSFPYAITINSAKPIPNDIINYVFPYVVSFMGISYCEPGKFAGFLVFLLWMFAITYKSGQIIMNPLLLMFGWQLYEANIMINNVPREVRILKRGILVPGHQSAQKIQDFYITKDAE